MKNFGGNEMFAVFDFLKIRIVTLGDAVNGAGWRRHINSGITRANGISVSHRHTGGWRRSILMPSLSLSLYICLVVSVGIDNSVYVGKSAFLRFLAPPHVYVVGGR
jgi:hypothetical protein